LRYAERNSPSGGSWRLPEWLRAREGAVALQQPSIELQTHLRSTLSYPTSSAQLVRAPRPRPLLKSRRSRALACLRLSHLSPLFPVRRPHPPPQTPPPSLPPALTRFSLSVNPLLGDTVSPAGPSFAAVRDQTNRRPSPARASRTQRTVRGQQTPPSAVPPRRRAPPSHTPEPRASIACPDTSRLQATRTQPNRRGPCPSQPQCHNSSSKMAIL
jgi:hypothetical protein